MEYKRISTCYGDVMVKYFWDVDTCTEGYCVCCLPETEDDVCGKYLGDFVNSYSFESEYDDFVCELEEWLEDKELLDVIESRLAEYGVIDTNKEKQNHIITALENLKHKRFNKESLEKELSTIFNEDIHIELGYEDVDDLMDYDYMFSSEQDIIGGDFDIYFLKGKPNSTDKNTIYVTEVAIEFWEKY